jgi:trans-aconitate methyltransferase
MDNIPANLTFDRFYLDENRRDDPKESFKFILKAAKPDLDQRSSLSIADVGCATGELLHYIKTLFPHAQLFGFDIQEELLSRAKQNVPEAKFQLLDITAPYQKTETFDAVFMCGVHAAFDHVTDWLPNFLKLLNERGVGFVFGNFNPDPYDVLVKVRKAGDTGPFMANWNMLSQQTVVTYLEAHGYTASFHHFQISIDIPRRPDNLLRSWTFKLEDGSRATINATQLLHQNYLLRIKRR